MKHLDLLTAKITADVYRSDVYILQLYNLILCMFDATFGCLIMVSTKLMQYVFVTTFFFK